MLLPALRLLHGQLGEILHVDGLQAVAPRTEGGRGGQVAQGPRHVVDEDGFFRSLTEQHGGTQDAVRDARCGKGGLQLRLAAEVQQLRMGIGMRDAGVDNPLHARRTRPREQAFRDTES